MDFESANIGIFFDMERFGLKNMSYINATSSKQKRIIQCFFIIFVDCYYFNTL